MALEHNYTVGIITKSHLFDSVADQDLESNWYFKYTTTNANGTDATEYPDQQLQNKGAYPSETIFFDVDSDMFTLTAEVKNVYIDREPIIVTNEDVHYTAVMEDHKCSIKFKSMTPIDIKNIDISCGQTTLFRVMRKENNFITTDYIYDISIDKDTNIYTLTFYLDKNWVKKNEDYINENQIAVTIWNLAGNYYEYTTNGVWLTIDSEKDVNDLTKLKIKFIDPIPENRIVFINSPGQVTVEITNPNPDFYELMPKYTLTPDSVGSIDPKSISFDKDNGVLKFNVINITDTGYVIVEAWLEASNYALTGTLKNSTYAEGMDGEWIGSTEGRLIKFGQNVPKYLKSDNYAAFAQMTQDFMNTMYTSLSNGKHIGILEKVARINNFNNVETIENPIVDEFKSNYNITIDPNLEVYKKFLESKKSSETVQRTKTVVKNIDDETTNVSPMADGGDYDPDAEADTIVTTETVTEILHNTIFSDITGEELLEFVKDLYKNIPYYNQIAGTYRGIKFILNQLGLCVKLVEIWSSREIQTNFVHEERLVREDEINAIRTYIPDNTLAAIGRYYLTSRFDIDVMESGLTFTEFNEMAFNIVKLILSIKPIHRVLRKLVYIFVANTDIHFKYFLLDQQNTKYGYKNDSGKRVQQVKYYNYTWNLLDSYPASKHYTYGNEQANKLVVNKLFVPFTAVEAELVQLTHDGKEIDNYGLYNRYGEYKESNPKFYTGKYAGQLKPVTSQFNEFDYIAANKNTYHNLCNFQHKIEASKLTKIQMSFLYVEKWDYINDSHWLRANGKQISRFTTDDGTNNLSGSVYTKNATFTYNNKRYSLINYILGLIPELPYDGGSELWVTHTFYVGRHIEIESATNGFYITFKNAAQSIFDTDLHMNWSFNGEYNAPNGGPHITPFALYCRMENLGIPLGTNYITQIPYDNTVHTDYTIVFNPYKDGDTTIIWKRTPGVTTEYVTYKVYIDNTVVCTDLTTPVYDITSLTDGEHTIKVESTCQHGDTVTSEMTFTVTQCIGFDIIFNPYIQGSNAITWNANQGD